LILIICFCSFHVIAQDSAAIATTDSAAAKVKWWQFLKKVPKPPHKGSVYYFPLPMLSFNPTNNFLVGVGCGFNWYGGGPSDTRLSSAHIGVAYTLKNQILSAVRTSIYTNHDNWILIGDWRYQLSSQPGFGLGTGPQTDNLANGVHFNDNPYLPEPANVKLVYFNFLRLHETVLRRVIDKFYLGLGYHLDYYYHIDDKLLDLKAAVPVITDYYSYTISNGFNPATSVLSGVSVNAVYDTRDNQNAPNTGRYAFVSYKYNPVFLGSSRNSGTIWIEYRDYVNFTRDHHNILCFWAFGNFVTSGQAPYMNLPAIGWDQYGKSGEGYMQGRFRGESLLFGEIEYRRHLFGIKNYPNLLGLVVFANMTTADSKENDISLFRYVAPAFGTGLRVSVSTVVRMNAVLDYAIGLYGSMGVYLKLNEAF
jgi:hypothetical protein